MIVTYLGHQGWSVESAMGHVLIDPVFRSIGNAGVQLPIWPDREIDPATLGLISGIILSHEHSDHFDIETLYRIPWRGTVYVSYRSSRPMIEIIEGMGYSVTRMTPYQVIEFSGVRITVLPLLWSLLEPDAYGFLIEGDDGTSFFTSVDGMPHENTVAWLRRNCPKRTADNFTNNYMEPLPELTGSAGGDLYAAGAITSTMIHGVEKLEPTRVVLSGQGWSYPPQYSELNHRFFNVTHERMLPILTQVYPHIRWEAPEPGTRIGLAHESLDGAMAPFVASRSTTSRDYDGYTAAAEGRPWSRITRLSEPEMRRVTDFVRQQFGQKLNAYAPDLMRQLFSMSTIPENRLLPTVALRMRDDSGSRHYLLDQGWLEFVPAPKGTDLRRDVAGGVEIWASDLLLLAEGREEPYLVYETAVRRWSNAPAIIGSALHVHMFLPFGPRLQPAEFRRSYEARLAEVSKPALLEGG
ncbi:MBL fold metallo-hydrolase [Streptomyces sp. Lzd4kr]|nr:MBL fold metallo-hydrolase [Streptomyces sp. Lzd4kr]